MKIGKSFLSISLLTIISLFLPYPSDADPLDNWHWIDSLPQSYFLRGVTYGNGLFVAVGDLGVILTSTTGRTWTPVDSNTTNDLLGVSYVGGNFIAVGVQGTIITSSDGKVWTLKHAGTSGYLDGVGYGNGTFVVVGDSAILTSPDGEVWTEQNYPIRSKLLGIAYGNNIFVTVGGDYTRIMPNMYFHGIILTSSDAVTWTSVSEFNDRMFFDVTYANGIFVALTLPNVGPLVSSDGTTWTGVKLTEQGLYWFRAVAYGFGTFVGLDGEGVAGGTILTSPDGVTWTPRSIAGANFLDATAIAYGNGTFVAVGGNGKILQSDPSEVEIQSPPNNIHFNSCTLDTFVAFSWRDQEIFRNYELQLASDQQFTSGVITVKTSAATATIKKTRWKKILMPLEGVGGIVYWRVIGIQPNGTATLSEARSIIVDPPEAAGLPSITPTMKNSRPELSWQNNCNTKFKVCFGNDPNFTRKSTFTFNDRTPNDDGGGFSKTLTQGQWMAVRRLVGDEAGSTIYWYVESWEGLGRYSRSNVMDFVLGD